MDQHQRKHQIPASNLSERGKSRTLSSLSLWCDPEGVPRQADWKTLRPLDLPLRILPEHERATAADDDDDGGAGGELLDDLLPLDPIPRRQRRSLLHEKREKGRDSNDPDLERVHKRRFAINVRLNGRKKNWESKKEGKAWDWDAYCDE